MSVSLDNPIELYDFFKELGSVGSGNASSVLSWILDKKIILDIKNVKFDKNKVSGKFSDLKTNDFCMVSKISGGINGLIVFNSNKINKNNDFFNFAKDYEIGEEEVVYEIFNLGISYYLSSISNLINEKINVSELEFNKSESLLLQDISKTIENYICVETSIICSESKEIIGSYLFVISKDSLDDIIDKFQFYKILICDDTSFMRVVAKDIIRENYPHMAIEEAVNGNEAFDKYVEWKPDLVIMDLVMPECDGIHATENILKYDPNAKIIITSSTAIELEVLNALKAGAKDFLAKPYNNQRVLKMLKRVLFNKKSLSKV